MRKILIEDKKITTLLNEKSEISKRQKAITDEITKLEQEFNKNMGLYARIDEKARPLVLKLVEKEEMGEFEQISKVSEEKKGWFIQIADRLEELRERMKQDKEATEKDIKKDEDTPNK